MKTATLMLSFLLILVGATASASPSEAPEAPVSVIAASVDDVALVAWSPGESGAEAYNVYGVVGTTLTLLTQTEELAAEVLGGFDTYAVTSVSSSGSESDPTYAPLAPCVRIDRFTYPYVFIGLNCAHLN